MNNPKLTNVLLIVLLVINSLMLCGWACSSMHKRGRHQRFAMHERFNRGFGYGYGYHGQFNRHYGRRHDGGGGFDGGFHRGFRNHNNG